MLNRIATNDDAAAIVGRIKDILKPGGWVIMTAYDERSYDGGVSSFVATGEQDIRPRRQLHLDLPFYQRANRDIQILFRGFVQVDSFLYTSGLREFIFRKPEKLRSARQ